MRNYTLLFLFGALITQSEIAYSCETKDSDRQDLKVVQQLKNFSRYALQRQNEMRKEAEELRTDFAISRQLICVKINTLECNKREIKASIWDKYNEICKDHCAAFLNLKAQKVDEFFQNFDKTGGFYWENYEKLIESCVLYAKVMPEAIQHCKNICKTERDQALTLIDINIAQLNIEVSRLEHYGLFTANTPTSQLRTQFLNIDTSLEMVKEYIPLKVLVEAELQEVEAGKAKAETEAATYQLSIAEKANELSALFLGGKFAEAQLSTQEMQKTTENLTKVREKQQELAHKIGELTNQLASLPRDEGAKEQENCFEFQLEAIREYAALLQLYAKDAEVQKLQYQFNALSLQDHEFIANLLAFRTSTSAQGS